MRSIVASILFVLAGTAAFGQSYKTITATQCDTLIRNHAGQTDLMIIDCRTPSEYANERLDKARNFDVSQAWYVDSIDKIDRNKVCLVYCWGGSRSPGACDKLIQKSFKTVYNMKGGISAWKSAGLPTVKGTGIDVDAYNALIVRIYPNPVVDLSTLEIAGFEQGEVRIEILNALGSLVMSRKMVPGSALTLNGHELSPGFYFYRLILPENQVKSGRFQVAR